MSAKTRPKIVVKVRCAKPSEHEAILKVARTSKYLGGFGNSIYSGPDRYAVGAIGIAKIGRKVVGFVCLRHAVRKPQTTVYDIGTLPEYKKKGVGKAIIDWVMEQSPWNRIVLNVDVRNKEAIDFYKKIDFKTISKGTWKNNDKYITMELTEELA